MRILFITSASHAPSQSGYNHFQRVEYLSRNADLTLWARKGAAFDVSAKAGTPISRAAIGGKLGLFLHVFGNALAGRARAFDIVLTEPSLLSLTGLVCKLFGARNWVVDVWDVPGRIGGARIWPVRQWLRLNRWILKQSFRYADFFLLSIRPDYEFAYFGVPRDRMLLMKNAIRVDEFPDCIAGAGEDETFNILCTRSTYHSDMGLDTMAAAYARLRRQGGGALSLTIVGRIPEALRAQIACLDGDGTVEFCDFLEKEELKRRIARAGVCVIPFRDVPDLAQTFPIKVIEYMAVGKPVIASRIGGMSELIDDGETGLLFRAGDPVDLAAKIDTVRQDAALAARLGKAARQRSRDFDYAVKGRTILDALRALTV